MSIRICNARYRGIRVSIFGGFWVCGSLSGKCHRNKPDVQAWCDVWLHELLWQVVDQYTATHSQQQTATHCDTLQHNVTRCSTLQHIITHCNILQHTCTQVPWSKHSYPTAASTQYRCCSVLQCVALCCSVLQCVAVWCSVLRCSVVCNIVLQCAAVCCHVLQRAAVSYSVKPSVHCKYAGQILGYFQTSEYIHIYKYLKIKRTDNER